MGRDLDKPKLGMAIKQALTGKAMSIARAAATLGVSDGSLRVWLTRNNYPRPELIEILRLAGLSEDIEKLATIYQFKIAQDKRTSLTANRDIRAGARKSGVMSLEQALSHMDARIDHVRLYQQFGEDVRLLFGSMAANDLFIYLSLTEYPFEMRPAGWTEAGEQIAHALQKGAYFVYVCIEESTAKTLREAGVIAILPVIDYQIAFEQFKNQIRALITKHGGKIQAQDLDRQVVKMTCAIPAFWVPGHKYVLFKPYNGVARSLARFPTGSNEREFGLHLPLDQGTTNQLVSFAGAALVQQNYLDLADLLRHAGS